MLNRPSRETRSCATNRKAHPPAPVTRRAFRCGCDVAKTTTFQQRAEIAAREFVSRKTQADAYRKAYPSSLKWKPEVVHSKASTFLPTVGFGKGLSRFRTQLQNGTTLPPTA